tara:strand:- start:271 stop:423 length:153 start_codon:yes stop_codon:yes gene_type:complete
MPDTVNIEIMHNLIGIYHFSIYFFLHTQNIEFGGEGKSPTGGECKGSGLH